MRSKKVRDLLSRASRVKWGQFGQKLVVKVRSLVNYDVYGIKPNPRDTQTSSDNFYWLQLMLHRCSLSR